MASREDFRNDRQHLRVGVACEYTSLNGGEHSLLAVCDALVAERVEITALLPDDHGPLCREFQKRNQPFVFVNWRGDEASVTAQLREIITAQNLQLLHANSLTMGRRLGSLTPQLPVPTTSHCRDIMRISAAAREAMSQHHKVVAVSDAARMALLEQGLPADRVITIYNGIDLRHFQPSPSSGWLHEELGLPRQVPLIGAIGQICLRKGLRTFAAAAVLLQDHPSAPHFVLVGERHSQKAETIEMDEAITAAFMQAGMELRLHRLGERDDVKEIYPELTLLMHAAEQEPFGRVLLEAAACGTAIVATKVGGTEEMLTHRQSALLAPPKDAHLLASAAGELLDNPGLAEQVRIGARQTACGFPIERSAGELLEVWRNAIAEGKHSPKAIAEGGTLT